ncbi:MAG: cell envelope integrity protein TolA [Tatlockia sp.]|nr:cell envelope integrity protein TolA [Tatlockia sp.]
MIFDNSYRKAFLAALCFHLCLAIALYIDPTTNQRPAVITPEAKNEPSQAMPLVQNEQPVDEVVKAVSIDNQEVMETVNRLKQERANQLKAEQTRQQDLVKQAEMARKERLQEQQHLAKLREESEKIAIAKKKQVEEEKRHLKQLAEQKAEETKKLQDLKAKQEQLQKKQKEESEKLALLQQKQIDEKLKNDKLKAEQARVDQAQAAKAKAELAEKNRQALLQEAANAAKKAFISGEVDKYKALIKGAISQRWIVPENIDRGLSSQFRIRLAPDGAVLEVSLTRSSGDSVLDRSAQTAIYKASPLPVPRDSATFELFRDISLTVRPENLRG